MSLVLTWDNTALAANTNVLAQRAYWRLKSVGGGFSTIGFTPGNDLATNLNTTEFFGYTTNKIYEFKVASICNSGGPTLNDNGLIEGIVFECITPTWEIEEDLDVALTIDVTGTDIEGAYLTLKKQSDDTIVDGPTYVARTGSDINYTYNIGDLSYNTDYYLVVGLKATVNGVEVVSNSVQYLNRVCGGNTDGFQISTPVEPLP